VLPVRKLVANLFLESNRGLLLDLVVFVANIFLMRSITGLFFDLFSLANEENDLAQLSLLLACIGMWVLPAAGAVLKRWHYQQRRTAVGANAAESTLFGCLFNPIFYFCLNLVLVSAIMAGIGQIFVGKKTMDNGAVFVPMIFAGLFLTILQTYLIYKYFSPYKKKPRIKYLMEPQSVLLGDICIFLNMILFQIGWNMLSFAGLGRPSGVGEFFGRLFFLLFLAFLVYFPPRMLYLAEDINKRRTWFTMLLANSPMIWRLLIGSPSSGGWT
jgi:hypothetical protein